MTTRDNEHDGRGPEAPGAGVGGLISRFLETLSGPGLMLGTLFFASSLTPTLVPRSYVTQGVLAGASFALGYGFGVAWLKLWNYLELPRPGSRLRRRANTVLAALCVGVAMVFLWKSAGWQNSIRGLMGMEFVDTAHPVRVCAAALATFAVFLGLARLFRTVARILVSHVRRFIPRRIANAVGVGLALLLFWSIASEVLFRSAFALLDSSFRELDALLEPERPQPSDPAKTGSPASLVKWQDLGRAGREFVAAGPSADDIRILTGRPALEPIRVYVGLNAADTARDRAKLALEELKRAKGFERSVLIVITPTGTGWIDPAAMDAVEFLHDGDIASVALQYSYLNSPLSLIVQPEYGAEAARALFHEIYGYWSALPKDRRPKLYLHGLSLGAMNSEKSAELFEMIGDPVQGALWSGPPFPSRLWRSVIDNRNEGSPQWLPEFRDGRIVRFANQSGFPIPATAPWGPMRIVYLQYASDPLVFFDYHDVYRPPAWMTAPRGSDVSPELRWYPVVTFLQIALDMAVATTTPAGFGHVYAPQHYVDAWMAVTAPAGWSPEALEKLKLTLTERMRASSDDSGDASPYENRGG